MDICGETVTHATIISSSIMILIEVSIVIVSTYSIFRYVKHSKEAEEDAKPPRFLYITGLIFFIISSILMLVAAIRHSSWLCVNGQYLVYMYLMLYYAQLYFLWLVLLGRLHYAFKGSSYELSGFVFNIYRLLLIIAPLVMITKWIIQIVQTEIIVITIIVFVFSLIMSSTIMILFLYKLFKVYSFMNENSVICDDNSLFSVFIKNTILAVICISTSMIEIICVLYCAIGTASDWVYAICEFVTLLDISANFVCIALSYTFFDNQYYKLCGCLDRACKSCLIIQDVNKEETTKSTDEESLPLL